MADFQIHALPFDRFQSFFAMPDEQRMAVRARRQVVERPNATPCRVSLQDAVPGETVLLIHHVHQAAETPFHASHAIYVRETALQAFPAVNEVPEMLRRRLLSVRAFDGTGMMLDADVAEGSDVEAILKRMFQRSAVETLHIHTAKQGCYLARASRA